MIAILMMVTFAAWCFSQAYYLHMRGRPPRASWGDLPPPLPPEEPTEPEESRPTPKVVSPRPVKPTQPPLPDRGSPDSAEDHTADLGTQPEDPPRELVVEIHRRELGGGETLACLVRWDGFRARWDPVNLSSDQVEELQRLVLERSGLWPGHGRIYVEAVARALDDPWGRTRWRVERVVRGAA